MLTYIQRLQTWRDTKERAKQFPVARPSQEYSFDSTYVPTKQFPSTTITVEDIDSIQSGAFLADLDVRPAVLCLADPRKAGGEVDTGAGGQCESIFRRSNYCESLLDGPPFFPLEGTKTIYSPGITIFKSTEEYNYMDIPPFELDFIACSGLSSPALTPDSDLENPEDKELLEQKIETILQVAAKNGHLSVVLAPLGCGFLGNKARYVALAFQRVLTKWDGVFQKVVFACMTTSKDTFLSIDPTKNMSGVNYTVFSTIFRAPS
jgi:uncharacterized protein (TIGR02452 family)